MTQLNEMLDNKHGALAQEAALKELIRVSVTVAFDSVLLLGTGGVTLTGPLVSYVPSERRTP